MAKRDAYDSRTCFADVLGDDEPAYLVGAVDVLRAVGRRRLRSRPQRVHGAGLDETTWSFTPAGSRVVGAADDEIDRYYPIYGDLRQRFDLALGRPKYIRVDGDEDYEAFRATRRQPHLDTLDARLAKLEAAVADHSADNHAHGRVQRLEDELHNHLHASVIGAVVDATRGGQAVSLPLPPAARARARGRIECWLDGDEVIVSVRVPTAVVTSGAPLQPDFEDVVGCAEACGFDSHEALVLGCQLAPSVVGERVLADMGQALPCIGGEGVYVAEPAGHAATAAMMALLQRCQSGDRQACREAMSLTHDAPQLWDSAAERLQRAQREKARAR